MAARFGFSIDKGLGLVKWLVECGDVDFIEISGGNAENKSSKLHSKTLINLSVIRLLIEHFARFTQKEMPAKAPKISESTRIRKTYFVDLPERVQGLDTTVPHS